MIRPSNVITIFKKEMLDTLRDRRTLVFMLLVPIVAVPLLMTGLSSLMVSQITKVQKEVSRVVIEGAEYLPDELAGMIASDSGMTLLDESSLGEGMLVDHLKKGDIDLLVFVDEDFAAKINQEKTGEIKIFYDKAEMKSDFSLDKFEDILKEYKEKIILSRIEGRDISPEILTPFEIKDNNVAPTQKMVGKELGALLPYLIIIMCFMGAMYPAIDLAAGEKERGTLETLLVSPATRGEFVLGKYFVILVTGIVAAFLSLGSMVYSLNHMVSGVFRELAQNLSIGLDLQTIGLMVLIVLPLAGIFAGILLSVSIFARSFKEAQSYVTALNMFIILPAFVSFLPGIKMSYQMSLIPVLNASLILKDAISGTIQWNFILTAFLANAVLAAAALVFCRKWFERESVIFRM
nr:ABC transporter permease [candidate division Zixibacteria bacterium]